MASTTIHNTTTTPAPPDANSIMENTVEELASKHRRQYKSSTVWSIFAMTWATCAFGYASSIIGTTLGQPSFITYMGLDTASNATQLEGAITGVYYAGAFCGCLFSSWCMDRFGRKWAISQGTVFIMLSSALLAGSVNIAMFITFRFFTGWGAVSTLMCVPVWITEVVPPKDRGGLANITAVMVNIGFIAASYVGVGFFYYQSSSNAWRAPLAFACLPCLINLICMPWLPESPRWLLKTGKTDKAWDIIVKLHSRDDDPNHEFAQGEFYQIRKQIELDNTLATSFIGMLKRPSYRKRIIIACSMMFFLYSSGCLVYNSYGTLIYKSLGFSDAQNLQMQAGLLLACLSGVIISLFVVDRIPRNVSISAGLFSCVVWLTLEAALTAKYLGTENKPALEAAVAMLYLYIIGFAIFNDGLSNFYMAEVFPSHLRAKGQMCAFATYSLTNLVWLQAAPTAFANIGWKYYLFFILFTLLGAVVTYFYYPNTLNMPLEEVAKLFGDEDLVAVYMRDIVIDHQKHEVMGMHVEVAEQEALQSAQTNELKV